MIRRDFLKTAALVPLIDWSGSVTPTHRPTELEKAIAAYHWPFARKGLGAEVLRLSRELSVRNSYQILSIMVCRVDEKRLPGHFSIWCNVIGNYKGLEEHIPIHKTTWANEINKELNKSGYIESGLERDKITVWLTKSPNHLNSYCPIFEQGESDWSYEISTDDIVFEQGVFEIGQIKPMTQRYYKYGLPTKRSFS